MARQSTEDLRGSETTSYGDTMMDTRHETFVQTHRMCNARARPNVNHELWVITMYQHTLVGYGKRTALVGIVILGEAVCAGQGRHGKSPSAVNIQLHEKNKVYFEI